MFATRNNLDEHAPKKKGGGLRLVLLARHRIRRVFADFKPSSKLSIFYAFLLVPDGVCSPRLRYAVITRPIPPSCRFAWENGLAEETDNCAPTALRAAPIIGGDAAPVALVILVTLESSR